MNMNYVFRNFILTIFTISLILNNINKMERNEEKEDFESSEARSQYQSTFEATGSISNKEEQQTERLDGETGEDKDPLLSNIKLLYEQNTERCRRRTAQMRKLRGQPYSDENSSPDNFKSKVIPVCNTVNTVLTTNSSPSKSKLNSEPDEEGDFKDFADNLNCSVEIKGDEMYVPYEINMHKSFIPLTNTLVTKNLIKEENVTPSYLLALNQCNYDEDSFKNKYNSTKGVRHIRLPSGKNFLINSIIEEEVNETYTDSDMSSLKKRAFLLSPKSNINSTESNKFPLKTSREVVGSGKDNNFFNRIRRISTQLDNSTLKIITGNAPTPCKLDFCDFNEKNNQMISRHVIAKSEIFNNHNPMKSSIDEIVKQKEKENLTRKLKTNELISKYFNKTIIKGKQNFFLNQLGNKKTTKKFLIDVQHNSVGKMVPLKSTGFKTSQPKPIQFPIGKHVNTSTAEKIIKIEEYDSSKVTKLSKEDFEVRFFSPLKKEFANISNKGNTIDFKAENDSTKINFEKLKDNYKRERKKSNSFKSEDLRISSQSNLTLRNLFFSPKHSIQSHLTENKIEAKGEPVTKPIISKSTRPPLDLFKSTGNNNMSNKKPVINNSKHKKTQSVNSKLFQNNVDIKDLQENKQNFVNFLSYKGNYLLNSRDSKTEVNSAKTSNIDNSIFHNTLNTNLADKSVNPSKHSSNTSLSKLKISPSIIRVFSNTPAFLKAKHKTSASELSKVLHLSHKEEGDKSRTSTNPNASTNSITTNSNNTTNIVSNPVKKPPQTYRV